MSKELLTAAEALARHIGAVALGHYRSLLKVETKPDGSPVTIADREAETAAREWLAQHYPDDGILGEELGALEGSSGRTWVIDPIDGTKTFVRGVPLWGSLVALVRGEDVLAGAAFFPAVDELVVAAPAQGCWWNGQRARVSNCATLAGATVLITDERSFHTAAKRDGWRTLTGEASLARTWGDCYGYLLVATGRAEAMVDPIVNPWDAACFQPIITEAGGVFTDLAGRATAFSGSAIATNAALAASIRDYFDD
ncbi:MAG: histidinol-phosphatase [Gemmatimonadaceae bacterium]|nr:histidinol-phosphatase [Gemmatimonadaceae bacterium]MCW5827013.1 histidinol-phosphatase [Gemmatimonadaceae bacterium]